MAARSSIQKKRPVQFRASRFTTLKISRCDLPTATSFPAIQPHINKPLSPKDFTICEVDMRTGCYLNGTWHSMLPRWSGAFIGAMLAGRTSVPYAAIHNGKPYAVAIWSQPAIRQQCNGTTIELRRLACGPECPKNTASRMLSVMLKLVKYKWPFLVRAISYRAIDAHKGTIYKASGWRPVGTICNARPQRMRGSKQRATAPLQTDSRKQRWEIDLTSV